MEGPSPMLVRRLSDAYDVPAERLVGPLQAAGVETDVDAATIGFERHGDAVLLIDGGEVVATVDLAGTLAPVATGCATLDPYGDDGDTLVREMLRDPLAARVPTWPASMT